jgi:hypothetical protein
MGLWSVVELHYGIKIVQGDSKILQQLMKKLTEDCAKGHASDEEPDWNQIQECFKTFFEMDKHKQLMMKMDLDGDYSEIFIGYRITEYCSVKSSHNTVVCSEIDPNTFSSFLQQTDSKEIKQTLQELSKKAGMNLEPRFYIVSDIE